MAHKWLHLQNYLLQTSCRTSQVSVCAPVVPWDCCSSQGSNRPGTGGWVKGQLPWVACGRGKGKATCFWTLNCSWQCQPMEYYKKKKRDVLKVQGKKKERVRLEEAMIHSFRPFPPPKDHSVHKRRQSLMPLALKALLVFEVLPPSWGEQQSLAVPTTTPAFPQPTHGLGRVRSHSFPFSLPVSGGLRDAGFPKLCCSVTLRMTN